MVMGQEGVVYRTIWGQSLGASENSVYLCIGLPTLSESSL